MAKDLFKRYIWLIDLLYRSGELSYEQINEKWQQSSINDNGEKLPLRTFHNHRKMIDELFDINIKCDKQNNYLYYIENIEDLEKGNIRNWLLSTFTVSNLVQESQKIKHRILLENIPSGRKYLTPLITSMKDNFTVRITYQSFTKNNPSTFLIEPYCVKVFKLRWYVIARSPQYDKIMTYALDRIMDLHPTNTTFDYPPEFDPQAFFSPYFGIIVNEECPIESIQLKTFGNKTKYLQALPLHPSQQLVEQTAQYAVFRYNLRPTYDFIQELFSHENEIEVLHPQWLREHIIKITQEMYHVYFPSTPDLK